MLKQNMFLTLQMKPNTNWFYRLTFPDFRRTLGIVSSDEVFAL